MKIADKRSYNVAVIFILILVFFGILFNIGYVFTEVGFSLLAYFCVLGLTAFIFVTFDFNLKILPIIFCIYRFGFILFLILFLNKNNLSSLSVELVGNDEIPWIVLFAVDAPSFVLNLIIWGLISLIIPASVHFNTVVLPCIIFMTFGTFFYYLTIRFFVNKFLNKKRSIK